MTKYSNGTYYERLLKNQLLEQGATLCVRSAGSKSKADLVCFTKSDISIIQIKTTSKKTASFKREIGELKDIKVAKGVVKVLAIYWKQNKDRDKQGWEFWRFSDGFR